MGLAAGGTQGGGLSTFLIIYKFVNNNKHKFVNNNTHSALKVQFLFADTFRQ